MAKNLAIEGPNVYRTPVGDGGPMPPDDGREWVAYERSDGTLECHDPLFDEPYVIGDGSTITDPTVEKFMLLNWRHNAVGMSTRQLQAIEPFETKQGTGRWSRLGHEMSVAVLTARHGGSPLQVMHANVHDMGHRKGSHNTDDMLGGRGIEATHEEGLPGLSRRIGFTGLLESEGLIDAGGYFYDHPDTHVDEAFDNGGKNGQPSFCNQPGSTASMEGERVQYIGHEGQIWVFPGEVVREATRHAVRAEHPIHGDHIVFDEPDPANIYNIMQTREATEHWGDSVSDVLDEGMSTIDRRMLTFRHPQTGESIGRAETLYHPADVLYTSEEDWHQRALRLAEIDPFTSAMLKVVTALTAHQRRIHEVYDGSVQYAGPRTPSWMHFQNALDASRAHTAQGIHKRAGYFIALEMMPGKARRIDPWVVTPGKDWRRLSEIMPESKAYRDRQSQWLATKPYDAVIDYSHPAIGLTPAEKRSIGPGIRQIREKWPAVLQRPDMPDELLARRYREAGEQTRLRARGGRDTAVTEIGSRLLGDATLSA